MSLVDITCRFMNQSILVTINAYLHMYVCIKIFGDKKKSVLKYYNL